MIQLKQEFDIIIQWANCEEHMDELCRILEVQKPDLEYIRQYAEYNGGYPVTTPNVFIKDQKFFQLCKMKGCIIEMDIILRHNHPTSSSLPYALPYTVWIMSEDIYVDYDIWKIRNHTIIGEIREREISLDSIRGIVIKSVSTYKKNKSN